MLLLMIGLVAFAFQQRAIARRAQSEAVSQRVVAEKSQAEAVVQRVAAEKAQAEAVSQRVTARRPKPSSRPAQQCREGPVDAVAQRVAAEKAQADAVTQRDNAEAARVDAETQRQVAVARELSAAALNNLEVNPERSLLLSLHAVSATISRGKPVLREAEEALHRAVQASRLQLTLATEHRPDEASYVGVAFSPDGTRVATAARGCVRNGQQYGMR